MIWLSCVQPRKRRDVRSEQMIPKVDFDITGKKYLFVGTKAWSARPFCVGSSKRIARC